MNREGDTPLSLARPETPVWVALQINRKLRRGVSNRLHRTERIICRCFFSKSFYVECFSSRSPPHCVASLAELLLQ